MPLKPAIRLVKGAYAEPPEIAFTAKKDVDANYLALCAYMLPEVKHRRMRLVLGTHDTDLFAKAWRFAPTAGLEMSRLEIARLYGIPTVQQMRVARAGLTLRELVAYGAARFEWCLLLLPGS